MMVMGSIHTAIHDTCIVLRSIPFVLYSGGRCFIFSDFDLSASASAMSSVDHQSALSDCLSLGGIAYDMASESQGMGPPCPCFDLMHMSCVWVMLCRFCTQEPGTS